MPAEGSLLPETYIFDRGMTRAGSDRAHAGRPQPRSSTSCGQTRSPDLPIRDEARGGDPGLDRREGNRRRRRAAARRRRLRQSPAQRHEAAVRSDDHLRPDQGRAARPRHPPKRTREGDALQHLCDHRPAADADRQSRPGLARGGAEPGADARTSISSPTAPAAMSSPPTLEEHRRMCSKWREIERQRAAANRRA